MAPVGYLSHHPQGAVIRFAAGSLATATVLFIATGFGAAGSWALPVSAAALLAAAIVGAIAMEERDRAAPEGLLRLEAARAATQPVPVAEPWREAA